MHNGVRRAKLRGSHRDSVARHVRFPGEREGRWIMGKVNSSSMSAMGMKYQTITYQLDACPNCASLRAEVERLRGTLDGFFATHNPVVIERDSLRRQVNDARVVEKATRDENLYLRSEIQDLQATIALWVG